MERKFIPSPLLIRKIFKNIFPLITKKYKGRVLEFCSFQRRKINSRTKSTAYLLYYSRQYHQRIQVGAFLAHIYSTYHLSYKVLMCQSLYNR